MEETTPYPTIEPTNFDLIIAGTGLPESIIASAASAAGKSVLQIDPNSFYGSHYASLPLHEFITFLQSQSNSISQLTKDESVDYISVPVTNRSVYSSIEITSYSSEPIDNSRRFSIDLAGPRVLFCADWIIDLILKTGINQYMVFKSVDGSFISDAEGNLGNVPDSKNAIFMSRSLRNTEKTQLMGFFKMALRHFESENGRDKGERISEEDLESPFVMFLSKLGLSEKLKSVILYAIVMAGYDQDNMEACRDVIKTKDGISRLKLYLLSIGRFPNANGAMIYPLYGQGELPQSFCRRAAVKGCIQVLRMPITTLLIDKDTGTYKGIKLVSGQELFSPHLIFSPSLMINLPSAPIFSHELSSNNVTVRDVKEKVARGVCITKNSLKPDMANILVFFPPRSLFADQMVVVRVFQSSSNLAVCPSGMFVTYISAVCDDVVEGKKLLHSAINALFLVPITGNPENSELDGQNENTEVKPSLIWSALYLQDLTMDERESVTTMNMPDEHLDYNSLLDATEKIFQNLYPGEEFFPETNVCDNEAGSDLET